eukprot:SAG22_NODE_6890_length_798_cov_1.835479_2_plen_47_part_01
MAPAAPTRAELVAAVILILCGVLQQYLSNTAIDSARHFEQQRQRGNP